MNILLAGGRGFIGTNIREKLGKKYTFFSPTHQELDFLDTESVERYFRKHPVDVVIYALNIWETNKTKNLPNVLDANLRCFFNVVRFRRYFKKMIFLGSGAEYNKQFPIVKIKESDFGENIPIDDYGLYKYICSEYIINNRNIINLRLFGVFGKYEDYKIRFISQAICRNLFNLPIIINKNVYFDYLYVDDLVRIIEYFLTHKSDYNTFNVGFGEKIDLVTIAKLVNKISKKPVEIIIKNKGLQNEYTCDTTRLRKEIGKFEFTKIEDTIEYLYKWYQQNKSLINKNHL
jgi:GDP-L-fucose synthase